jgi:hypothetical protein
MIEYFKKQLEESVVIDEEKLTKLRGKSLYSDYDIEDKILFFMKEDEVTKEKINMTMVTVVVRELEKMAKDFNFVRMSSDMIPVFKKS